MVKNYNTTLAGYCIYTSSILLALLIFAILTKDFSNSNIINVAVFMLSISCITSGVVSVKKKGLKCYNLFLVLFYMPLAINCFGLSEYQSKKELIDIYYYFTGPLILVLFLYFSENIKVVNLTIKTPLKIKISSIVCLLLISYLILFVYIYQQVGLNILSGLLRYQDKSQYQIAGVSGIAGVLVWTLIMLVPHVGRKLGFAVASILVLCAGVLQFNRGNIMRIILFMFLWYAIKQKHQLMLRKNIIKATAFVIFLSIGFTILGEIRQFDPSNLFDIKQLLLSRVDNSIVNWIYAYSAINFDVLKLVAESEPFYFPYNIFMPFINIFGDKKDVGNYYDTLADISFNGFNASTFLGDFVIDFGIAYVFEMIVFGILIGTVIIITRNFRLTGVYCFIMLLLFMSFSGNYFNLSYYLYAILFTSSILMICPRDIEETRQGVSNARC